MATFKAFDEVLITVVEALPEVILRSHGMHHMEVFQKIDDSEAEFPCIVYELLEDVPILELSDDSGMRHAAYALYIISTSSDDLRELATSIKTLNTQANNDTLKATYFNVEWITDFAVEQQEKGNKCSTLVCTVHHWGDQ
jgi:DNA-dependent RNA polymerase auxiliary subunit epsilon